MVTTDASDAAVGAILEQDFSKGLQPVAFASRKLNGAEIRYSAYKRELLGIVWALGDMKSDVVMVVIVLIWDFIFMFLCLDLVLYIEGYFTFYMSQYLG